MSPVRWLTTPTLISAGTSGGFVAARSNWEGGHLTLVIPESPGLASMCCVHFYLIGNLTDSVLETGQ